MGWSRPPEDAVVKCHQSDCRLAGRRRVANSTDRTALAALSALLELLAALLAFTLEPFDDHDKPRENILLIQFLLEMKIVFKKNIHILE
jgi:hypothetical protein